MAQTLRQAIKNLAESHSDTSIVAQDIQNVKHNQDILIPQPIFLGSAKHQLASFVPVCFPGIDAERLIYKLEAQGILVSTGAACAANKGTKSHVLAAIGLSDEEIAGSLRISLGSTNTPEQITEAAKIITGTVRQEYIRLGLVAPQPSSPSATRSSSGLSLQAEASSSSARVDKSSSLSTACGMVTEGDGWPTTPNPNGGIHV